MFKILTLQPDADQNLQALQDQYEIEAVELLGQDTNFNRYVLVQYDTAPSAPLSGSTGPVVDQAKKPTKGK